MAPKTSEIDSLQCKTSYEDFSPSYLLFEEILFVRNQRSFFTWALYCSGLLSLGILPPNPCSCCCPHSWTSPPMTFFWIGLSLSLLL